MKWGMVAAVALLAVLVACTPKPKIGPLGGIHWHADYKVFLDGHEFNFRQAQFMVKAPYVHIENMDGDVIHVHATGVTIGEFFRTLGMKFDKDCFVTNARQKYCNDGSKTLKLYVNGIPNELFGDYLIGDLDQVLISYGVETPEEIQAQLAAVTDKARTQSESGRQMRLR